MAIGRRAFGKLALSAGSTALLGACGSSIPPGVVADAPPMGSGAPPPHVGRPRALVVIHLWGGIDAVLSTDPKRRGEVASEVDVPYEDAAIQRAGNVEFGPLLRPLEAHIPGMAFVNGVICSTVSHVTGATQTYQLRRRSADTAPVFVETLGREIRGDAPISAAIFTAGEGFRTYLDRTLVLSSRRDADKGVLHQLWRLANDDRKRRVLLRVLDDQLARCGANERCVPREAARALVQRMPREPLGDVPTFAEPRWGAVLRDALFLLQHRLTPTVHIYAPTRRVDTAFDSHVWNHGHQFKSMDYAAPALGYLFDELRRRRSPEGTVLADEVAIVIASEVGRFPILNPAEGKDHFPELPVIFMGPGLRSGVYGQTNAQMVSEPISFKTGRPSSGAHDRRPVLEDVGTTVLRWFGVDSPASRGYAGQTFEFLLS